MDKKSKWGYKKGSEFRGEPFIDIKSNLIDMSETPEDLLLIPDKGKPQIGKAFSGQVLFPQAKKVREIPMKRFQHGGNYGLAGESTVPVSPFINLKPFINKYKLSHGGVIDYMSTLPEEQQYLFAEEFDSFDKDTQDEIADYLRGGYYQMGGINEYQRGGLPNAELEDQETLITPDGELQKITGKKHSEGGEEVNLPGGTRIYSEYIKAPQEVVRQVLGKESKKKMSYADLSKKFPTQPFIDILDDPKSDEYQKTSAQIKLANNLGKLDTIFFAQEKEKESKNNKFQYGGIKKYQMAGMTPSEGFQSAPVQYYPYFSKDKGTTGYFNFSDISNRFQNTPVENIVVDPTTKSMFVRRSDGSYDYVGKQTTNNSKQAQIKKMDYQQSSDYLYDYPKVHTEPSPTVTTGVVLNLRNDIPVQTINLPEVEITDASVNKTVSNTTNRGTKSRPKTKSNVTKPNAPIVNPEVPQSDLWKTIAPLEVLPQRNNPVVSNRQPEQSVQIVPNPEQVADIIIGQDDKDYPGTPKRDFKFGISPELAGTIADIGLALSDRLRVSEPTYYNRQKTPLFTRFVDFDDKEVQRMYDKNIQQIQQSNMPESVKQAQINELTSKYQDYQAKVDFTNLQRYETKRERDTDKLQKYVDYNVDQRVADLDNYRQRKARVDELRDMFNAQRKSRIVNSLKSYAEYADQINKTNEFTDNYKVNPITGRIDYKPQQQTNLTENILNQYAKSSNNKIDLGGGATARVIGDVMVITDKEGKISTQKLS